MDEVEFFVQGSASDPYHVVFKKVGPKVLATCTCPAGTFGKVCKHRVHILFGDPSGIIGDHQLSLRVIRGWVIGTDIEKVVSELIEAERQLAARGESPASSMETAFLTPPVGVKSIESDFCHGLLEEAKDRTSRCKKRLAGLISE